MHRKTKNEPKREVKDQGCTKEKEKSEIINNTENENKNIEYQEHLNSSTTSTDDELKLAPDLVDTNYLLPFKYGWTRSLVYRFSTNRTKSDVYYFDNTGKKYRSIPELSKHFINGKFSRENFTFSARQILENGSEYEIVRDAVPRSAAPRSANKKVVRKKNINRRMQSPSDSVLVTSSNESESRTDLSCSKRCRNQRGVAPSLKCVQCDKVYHPGCAIVQPALIAPEFVCLNCKSRIPNDAESKFLNSNLESLHISKEGEFIPSSLENSSQFVEILGNQKYVVVPRIMLPRMSFLSNPDDLIQVNVGRILSDNTEEISLELFRKTDVVEIDFENIDQD